jgi:hypothetical protein
LISGNAQADLPPVQPRPLQVNEINGLRPLQPRLLTFCPASAIGRSR